MGSRIFGHPVVTLALLGAALLAGCVDPGKRFDDFDRRVIDAGAAGPQCDGALRDINGEFLIALSPGFSPDDVLQFIATVDMTTDGDTATAAFSFQPLVAMECDPDNYRETVGDPLEVDDVEIGSDGAFAFTFDGAQVAGQANEVSCGAILADITLTGIIRSPDEWCGDGSGMVMAPTPANLEGSTFGAIRIDPGTVGDDLPAPQPACAACGEPDAG
ncbi:MAG TPA: hypothetical protein VMZ28_05465 [Kofleriaceae bacterium]|nr:hypothetical protein [Kofleriaceae bacterium]